ncbi:hypothetical protein, unlikely [Trypanosoma congolense IL3000]|uniref:Uncharacterized protein n=1 Tax=Trypanosoma congolense (strain IL3000) TaxID=1068625 RepID=F9W4V2_TRYCI|nr:hypothetical protein, unlikely [Trypanosoma congolense IL3000]
MAVCFFCTLTAFVKRRRRVTRSFSVHLQRVMLNRCSHRKSVFCQKRPHYGWCQRVRRCVTCKASSFRHQSCLLALLMGKLSRHRSCWTAPLPIFVNQMQRDRFSLCLCALLLTYASHCSHCSNLFLYRICILHFCSFLVPLLCHEGN